MSIEQADVVDAIGIEVSSGKVILTIADHLDWEKEQEHLIALQDKINTYIAFIESGELHGAYPDSAGREPVIEIVMRLSPSLAGVAFLNQVRPILESSGIELRSRTLED
ncbi:DUF6572 domain-containing protein [Sorangium sp. So ce1024]|jgi:hypothetical protein|uniref:DUF6572 domain-containing protein n=1 Tax=unclassified Sorangium TaxID=2621164 RepID=UPI003F0D378B